MYKNRKLSIFKYEYIFQILILIFLIPTAKSEVQKKIHSINYGITEKGIYLGIDKKVNPKIFLSFGINYLNYNPGYFDAGFSERIPLNIDIKGVSLSISKYLKEKYNSKWNLFLNSEIGFSSINASSKINLSKLYYGSGTIKIKCSSCGKLKMYTNNLTLTPKLSLGIERNINDRFKIRSIVGIQFIKFNDVNLNYESNYPLPNFVNKEINSSVRKINSEIDNFSLFQPAISILFNYEF
tara:strand:- start:207 stop:923 length:717 start_codon:yes stop_codon:yes gene_type:complete